MSNAVPDCCKESSSSEELCVDEAHVNRSILVGDSFSNGCGALQMGFRFIQPSASFLFLSGSSEPFTSVEETLGI